MDSKGDKVTKKILNLALEIIFLLTGENYMLVKKTSGDHGAHPPVSGRWSPSTIMNPPPLSLALGGNGGTKILEVTNRIIKLLMREEEALCLPLEEQKYSEGHPPDLQKKTTMEDQAPFDSSDDLMKQTSTRPYCRLSGEEHRAPQGDGLVVVKVEDGQDVSVRGEESCAEEEVSPLISPDEHYQNYSPSRHFATSSSCKIEDNPICCSSDFSLKTPECVSEDALQKRSAEVEKLTSDTQSGTFISQNGTYAAKKPYTCSTCGKSFARKTSLSIHTKIHSDVKPFSCSVCGKCFTQKSLVDRHEKVHTGEKPFSCLECGKSFRQKSHFARHAQIHTGVKPFSCADCGKCFTQKGDLVSHLRTHTGEKPFSCSECGACFSWKVQLFRHQAIHRPKNNF